MNSRSMVSGLIAAIVLSGVGPVRAQTLYWGGGTADKSSEALPITSDALSGQWTSSTKNWSLDSSGSAYTNFINGSTINLGGFTNGPTGANATITNLGSYTISGLLANLTLVPSGTYNEKFTLMATNAQVLTFTGTNAFIKVVGYPISSVAVVINSNIQLAGSVPLNTKGYGIIEVDAACDAYSGVVNVSSYGGYGNIYGLNLYNGSMSSVPLFTINPFEATPGGYIGTASMTVFNNSTTGVVNQLGDNTVIALSRGVFKYIGRGNSVGANSTETIGKILINGSGYLRLENLNFGSTINPSLVLSDASAGIDRGTSGRGVLIVRPSSSTGSGAVQGSPTVDLVVSNGVPTGVLLPWVMTTYAQFMQLNASRVLVPIPATQAPTDLSTWVAGSDYIVGTNNASMAAVLTNALAGDLSLHSLGFYTSASVGLTNAPNGTLTITSGSIAFEGNNNANITITNGTLTSGTNALYLLCGDFGGLGTLNVNCAIAGSGMDVIIGGNNYVVFGGPGNNTYSGTTYISGIGGLTLSKVGGAVAVPGDVVVEDFGSFSVGSGGLSPTSNVTLKQGAAFLVGSTSVSNAGVLAINGGRFRIQNTTYQNTHVGTGIQFNGGVIFHSSTANGSFRLDTDVGYSAVSTTQARWGRIDTATMPINLDGGNRTFTIADSSSLAAGIPEMVVDLGIANGTGGAGSLTKAGSGVLQLTTTNSYTGGTTVNNGTLQVSSITAPAQSGLRATVNSAANTKNYLTFLEPVANSLVVGQSISSAVLPANCRVVNIIDEYDIYVSSGATMTTQTTDIAVGAVARSGNLGTGPVVVTNAGTLLLDADVVVTNTISASAGGALVVNGTVVGMTSVTNGGSLRGTGTINGALDLTGGTLVANLLSDTTCDTLTVGLGSNVTLSASTSVAVTNFPATYTPRAGNTWTLLQCTGGGTISGMLPTVGNGYSLQTAAGNTQLNLVFPRRAMLMYIR